MSDDKPKAAAGRRAGHGGRHGRRPQGGARRPTGPTSRAPRRSCASTTSASPTSTGGPEDGGRPRRLLRHRRQAGRRRGRRLPRALRLRQVHDPQGRRRPARADQGRVLVDGKPVAGAGRDRGMVFQAYTSFGWLTVRENVEYGLQLRGVPAAERRDTVATSTSTRSGSRDFADRYPKDLSGGMKQRVAIARTLINKPRVVLMDEPFGALDPQTRWGMQGLLLDVSRTEDNTILFVTHDVSEAVYLADTVYVLSARPARILHRVDVPFFANRDIALKSAPEFRAVEKRLLDLLVRAGGRNRVEYAHGCLRSKPGRRGHRTVRAPPPPGSRAASRRCRRSWRPSAPSAPRRHPREAPVPEVRLRQPLQPLALRRRAGGRGPDAEPAAGRGGARGRGALAAVRARVGAAQAPALGPAVREGPRAGSSRGAPEPSAWRCSARRTASGSSGSWRRSATSSAWPRRTRRSPPTCCAANSSRPTASSTPSSTWR